MEWMRVVIEQEWIKHCEEQLERCPNERAIWETAIRESRERLEAYKLMDRNEHQAVREENS
jgi:hypothetical protein